MELRVWVDGTQRVVCGVKLTTTCQEIVFALAHATQQAGRFTMIERWRNNERLLSPNEQPLVTLQRWGEHMNEVEFILRKTSSDLAPPVQQQQQQQQQPKAPQQDHTTFNGQQNHNNQPNQPVNTRRDCPSSLNINQPTTSYQSLAFHQQPIAQQQRQYTNSYQPALPANHSTQVSKNFSFDDLYSTVNKKRNNQPPAVPAKPRVVNQIASMTSMINPQLQQQHQQQQPPLPQSQSQQTSVIQPSDNAQLNYYHNRPPSFILPSSNLRPRHPPGYLDYIEAVTNRNTLAQSMLKHSPYLQQCQQFPPSNMFNHRPYGHPSHQVYNLQSNGPSPSSTNNQYRYSTNKDPLNRSAGEGLQDSIGAKSANPIMPKLMDSGLIINRGSAVNIKLHSNSHNLSTQSSASMTERQPETSVLSNNDSNSSSVSQMGHDMLKVIEEQKKVLMNQKSELDRLDNDQEFWESKQNIEQTELVTRIEKEIQQLEELWKENQAQIRKLENQNFDKEIQELKSEQMKMELEISLQRKKLSKCELELSQCMTRIGELEAEISIHESKIDIKPQIASADSPVQNGGCDHGEVKLNLGMKNIQLDNNDAEEEDQSSIKEDEYCDDLEELKSTTGDSSDEISCSLRIMGSGRATSSLIA